MPGGAAQTLPSDTDLLLFSADRDTRMTMPYFGASGDYPNADGDTFTIRFGSVVTFTFGVEIVRTLVEEDLCVSLPEHTTFDVYQYVTDGTRRFDYNIVNFSYDGDIPAPFPGDVPWEMPDLIVREGVIEWKFDGVYADNGDETVRYQDTVPYKYEVDAEDVYLRSPQEVDISPWSGTRLYAHDRCTGSLENATCPQDARCEVVTPWSHLPYSLDTSFTLPTGGWIDRHIYQGCTVDRQLGDTWPFSLNSRNEAWYTVSRKVLATTYEVEGWDTYEVDWSCFGGSKVGNVCTLQWNGSACGGVEDAQVVTTSVHDGEYVTAGTGFNVVIDSTSIDCDNPDQPFTVQRTVKAGINGDSPDNEDALDPAWRPPTKTYGAATEYSYSYNVGDPETWNIDDTCYLRMRVDVVTDEDTGYLPNPVGFDPEYVITEAMKEELEQGARAWNLSPDEIGGGAMLECTAPYVFFVSDAEWTFQHQHSVPDLSAVPNFWKSEQFAEVMAGAAQDYYYRVNGVDYYWTPNSSSGQILLGDTIDNLWTKPNHEFGVHGQIDAQLPFVPGITASNNTVEYAATYPLSCVTDDCRNYPDGRGPDDPDWCGCFEEVSTYLPDGTLESEVVTDPFLCYSGELSGGVDTGPWKGEAPTPNPNPTSKPFSGSDPDGDKFHLTLNRINDPVYGLDDIPEAWNCLGEEDAPTSVWGSGYHCLNGGVWPVVDVPNFIRYVGADEVTAVPRKTETYIHSWGTANYTGSQVDPKAFAARFPRIWGPCFDAWNLPNISWDMGDAYRIEGDTVIPMVTAMDVTITPRDPYADIGLSDVVETWTVQEVDFSTGTFNATGLADFL